MFQAENICQACYKFVVTVASSLPIISLSSVPNTYDEQTKKYFWQYEEIIGYTLIPFLVHKMTARIDVYLCIEERDRETLDVNGYAKRFLREKIFSSRKDLRITHITGPILARPENVSCRIIKRLTPEKHL